MEFHIRTKIVSVTRLGRPSANRIRLLKVQLPTIAKAKELRDSTHEVHRKVYIRPDMIKIETAQGFKKLACISPAKENVLPRQEMDNKKRGSSGTPNRRQLHTTLSHNTNNQTHKLRVYYANVDNSLLSKYDEITLLIANNKYDVLAVTEVEPKHGTLPEQSTQNIPGYDLFTSDLHQPNSRGVVIYIKEQFQAKVVQPITGIIFYNAIWTSIKGTENATLLLCCIYRSGTPATAIPKDVALHEALLWSANHSGFSHKLLVGDFNHPTIEWTPSPYLPENIPPESPTNTFVDCIRDYFLFQHITEPTRFREGQNPTLDDLIFTNESEMPEQLKYLAPPGGSDHEALEFNFIFSIISSNLNRTVLLYDKGDYEKIKQLFNRDWTQVLQSMNPQEVFDTLEKSLHQATELCIPSKVITDVGRFKPLWTNKQALRKARKKHHAWIR